MITENTGMSAIGRYQALDPGLRNLTDAWPGADLGGPAQALFREFPESSPEEGSSNNAVHDVPSAHLYLSNPECSALPYHVDPYPAVVLALYGSKQWVACAPAETGWEKFRHRCSEVTSWDLANNDCEEFTMEPGDLLFLPMDAVHNARAGPEGAVHITYGPCNRGRGSLHRFACLIVPQKFFRKFWILVLGLVAKIVVWLYNMLKDQSVDHLDARPSSNVNPPRTKDGGARLRRGGAQASYD
jgi:hypothetical protein